MTEQTEAFELKVNEPEALDMGIIELEALESKVVEPTEALRRKWMSQRLLH